jgi:hypothetical protein
MPYVETETVSGARVVAAGLIRDMQELLNSGERMMMLEMAMQQRILSLPPDELAIFCNMLGQAHLEALDTMLNEQMPQLLTGYARVKWIIDSQDSPTLVPIEDPENTWQSIAEILAAQGLQLVLTDGIYTVEPITPEP